MTGLGPMANPGMRRGTGTWILPAGLLLLTALLGSFDMVNADIWWHLRTGQLISQVQAVPRSDWYTYTNPDASWVDLHWLFQLGAAAIYRVSGTPGLVGVKVCVGVATFALLLSVRRGCSSHSLCVAALLLPTFLYSGRFLVRPEVISIFFLAATFFVISRSENSAKWLWWLPLIQLAWVNCQSLFVLQWVVMGCFTIERVVQRFGRRSPGDPDSQWATWWKAIALCGIATMLNPYGIQGATFPFVVFEKIQGANREFYHAFAGELRGPVDFIRQFGLLRTLKEPTSLLMVGSFALATVPTFLLWRNGRSEIARPLILVAFAYLAFRMSRNSALLAVSAGYVSVWSISTLAEESWSLFRVMRPAHTRRLNGIVGCALVICILWVGSGHYHAGVRGSYPRTLGWGESAWYPHVAAKALSDPRMPDRVFAHHLGVAAVAVFHAAPDKKIHVDARLETNSMDTLAGYRDITQGLAAGDSRALRALEATDDPSQWPAILVSNEVILRSPMILQVLQETGRWVCVYCDFPQDTAHPKSLITGGSVFVSTERQKTSGLPIADTRWLVAAIRNRY